MIKKGKMVKEIWLYESDYKYSTGTGKYLSTDYEYQSIGKNAMYYLVIIVLT